MAAAKAEEAAKAHYWYALRVPPQKEFVAREILKRKGLTTFLPVEKRWRKRNKYTKVKELRQFPLAPRYIFTGFPKHAANWFDVFKLPVIQGVVGINGEPKLMDEAGMARMISLYQDAIDRPKEEKWMASNKEFKSGDIVEVMSGPFEGLKVPVVKIVGIHAKVLIQLFNAEVETEMDLANLAAA
jgi:transcription antitermination factor NusG